MSQMMKWQEPSNKFHFLRVYIGRALYLVKQKSEWRVHVQEAQCWFTEIFETEQRATRALGPNAKFPLHGRNV